MGRSLASGVVNLTGGVGRVPKGLWRINLVTTGPRNGHEQRPAKNKRRTAEGWVPDQGRDRAGEDREGQRTSARPDAMHEPTVTSTHTTQRHSFIYLSDMGVNTFDRSERGGHNVGDARP
jgi:hypothetical protein